MTLISTYGLIIFTNFVPDPLARYQCGWMLIGICCGILAINICVLIYTTIVDTTRAAKMKKTKRRYNLIMKRRKLINEKIEKRRELTNEQLKNPLR